MKKLKVGDVIYSRSYSILNSIMTVDRVTSNFAFCGNTKFKIDYDTNITIVPRSKWHSTSYYIETEELKLELKTVKAYNFVSNTNFSKLSSEKIFKIQEIIKQL